MKIKNLCVLSHRPEVIQIIQKKYGRMDKNGADYIYDLVSKYVTRTGLSSEKALENALLGTPYEGKVANLAKLVDFSMAREVAQGK